MRGGDFFQRARSKFISSNLAITNTKCRWTSDIKVSPVVGNDPRVAALLYCATLLYWCSAPLFVQDWTFDVHRCKISKHLHEGTTATLNPIPIHWLSPKPSSTAGFRRYQHHCRLQFNGRATSMCYCPGWRARPPSELSIIAGDASVSPQEPNSSLVPATLITTNSHLLPSPSKTTLQTQMAHHLAQSTMCLSSQQCSTKEHNNAQQSTTTKHNKVQQCKVASTLTPRVQSQQEALMGWHWHTMGSDKRQPRSLFHL